ncbi:MAG: hypothetical protein KJ906_02040 [Nanoarchaeota archaeon]|nr:hypothetical protein [Nanoarchaeota archaeon]
MRFYDLEIQSSLGEGANSVAEIARFAEHLGYSGIAICNKYESLEQIRKLKEEISKIETTVEIYVGVKIKTESVEELRKIIEQVREEVMVVVVAGGNYSINRAACENPKVDILAHPEFGRIDSGLDEVCLNLAKKNNVAIQINFTEIAEKYRRGRSSLLGRMDRNIRLTRELSVPTIVCSGAKSIWDMRDPREMISIVNIFGLEIEKSFSCLSMVPQNIIEDNKKRLSGEKITEGVELG